jgi:hypothetical protein
VGRGGAAAAGEQRGAAQWVAHLRLLEVCGSWTEKPRTFKTGPRYPRYLSLSSGDDPDPRQLLLEICKCEGGAIPNAIREENGIRLGVAGLPGA